MGLRDWVTKIDLRPVATPATPATPDHEKGGLSRLSQLSQGGAVERARHRGGHLSQPLGELGSHYSDDGLDAFEERAAIMEYDGGLIREEAERLAGMVAYEPQGRIRSRWRGDGLDLGDLRPCLWCRNLTRSGRCLAAWRGDLRASRDWEPTFPGQPSRCVGYLPPHDDPDQRPGHERWPELIASQARQHPEAEGSAATASASQTEVP